MDKKKFQNQIITQPLIFDNLLSGEALRFGRFEETYPLSEADYIRIKSSKNREKLLAYNFFFLLLGYALGPLSRLLDIFKGRPQKISDSEIEIIAFLLIISLSLMGFAWFSERGVGYNKTIKKIDAHFEKNPGFNQVIKQGSAK